MSCIYDKKQLNHQTIGDSLLLFLKLHR